MPRGSKPGERRGGRKPGTPNKSTALVDAAIYKAIQGLERAKAEEREYERWLAAQKAKEKGGALKKLKN